MALSISSKAFGVDVEAVDKFGDEMVDTSGVDRVETSGVEVVDTALLPSSSPSILLSGELLRRVAA